MLDLPLPGQLVAGKYLAQEELGRGGMGLVMAARHLSLDRPVALKFLLCADVDELSLDRFLREARAAAQIESEHVARVMDAARLDSGMPYIVMERLKGMNLKALLAREGQLPPSVAIDYMLQACDAVAEAHARGIVHRDLKPSNLFLCDRADGVRVVKVLDFGISKMRRDAGVDGAETTSAEVILGSPQYMAPEQIRSAKYADARSDIWSLGCILYELLAGRPAYRAETLPGLLASIVADEPRPLSAIRADVPASLAAVVRRCLAKDPERRFQSVGQLARGLAPLAPSRAALVGRISRVLQERAHVPSAAPDAAKRLAARWTGFAPDLGLGRNWGLAVVLGGAAVLAATLLSLRQGPPDPLGPAAPVPAASALGTSDVANVRTARPELAAEAASAPERSRAQPLDVASVSRAPLAAGPSRAPAPPRRTASQAALAPAARVEAVGSPEPRALEPVPAPAKPGDVSAEPAAAEVSPPTRPAPAPPLDTSGAASPARPRDPLDVFSDPR